MDENRSLSLYLLQQKALYNNLKAKLSFTSKKASLKVVSIKSLLSSNFTFINGHFEHCLLKLKKKIKIKKAKSLQKCKNFRLTGLLCIGKPMHLDTKKSLLLKLYN